MTGPEIKPATHSGGQIRAFIIGLTSVEVRDRIGFDSNVDEDQDRGYGASWSFTVNGEPCTVWYRNRTARAWGDRDGLERVFGREHLDWIG